MPTKEIIPPPSTPVPGFNDPGHLEADWVERIDLTSSEYNKYSPIPAGTLYSSIQGADSDILSKFGDMFLVHEVINPRSWPYSFRYWAKEYVQTEGQDYDQTLDVVIPYVDTFAKQGAEIGTPRADISTIDRQVSKVRTVDPAAISAALSNYLLQFPGSSHVQLPEVLESITSFAEQNSGIGDSTETAGSAAFSGSGSVILNPNSRCKSSFQIIPEASIVITQKWARNVPTVHYLFFLPQPVSSDDVLNKLTTLVGQPINAWPKFNPRMETLFAVGTSVDLELNANIHVQVGGSCGCSGSCEAAFHSGNGKSLSTGLSIKAIRVPPTIHGIVGVNGFGSAILPVSATATATTPFVGSTCGDFAPITNRRSDSQNVFAYVSPITFGPTDGATSIPTSGLYLMNTDAEPYRYGWAKIHAEVVDFANL